NLRMSTRFCTKGDGFQFLAKFAILPQNANSPLLFSICVWRRADAAGAVVHVTGIPVDYRQTFFSLNTNTEEIFHFARRIKLSTHFIRFTYIPDTFSGPFLPHQTAISP
ncbi:hypothetical protein, partial [Klebsiella pneumoniae]